MLLLDTNVVSELRKPTRDPHVARWARTLPRNDTFLSVVTVQEIELGLLLKERRDPEQGAVLRAWFDRVLSEYDGRILPVDVPVARRAATLHVPDPRPEHDALIAATALVHGLTVATRNTGDFEALGVGLVNPWQGG
jgi:predicted nucleic acid-binding protein